jgi:hypothetical protein
MNPTVSFINIVRIQGFKKVIRLSGSACLPPLGLLILRGWAGRQGYQEIRA